MINIIQDNMIKDLQNLIKIKSISEPAQGEYPFGKGPYDALQYCLDLCESFGFKTKQCGNYMGYAEIGQGEKLMGILVHVDVVPAGQGWNTDPFEGVIVNDRLYGRGVIDDKGPTIAAIYAMKEVLDCGKPLDKRVRIIFGCSEETGDWEDMEYYKKTEELPDFGFTPDADFPLIYAEKGILILNLKMKKDQSNLILVKGGEAHNMVPDSCMVTFINHSGEEITIIKKGKSAHGSMPELGINAIAKTMRETEGKFADFYNEMIGETVDGRLLGCYLNDKESGVITINPGIIYSDDCFINLTLDIRYPISYTQEDVVSRISQSVSKYDISVEILGGDIPVYTDRESEFIKSLMYAYRTVTGDYSSTPVAMGGGTYSKAMEHIVAFGPMFPGRECTEHQPNEYALIKDLYDARKIYKIAIENS